MSEVGSHEVVDHLLVFLVGGEKVAKRTPSPFSVERFPHARVFFWTRYLLARSSFNPPSIVTLCSPLLLPSRVRLCPSLELSAPYRLLGGARVLVGGGRPLVWTAGGGRPWNGPGAGRQQEGTKLLCCRMQPCRERGIRWRRCEERIVPVKRKKQIDMALL
jgi:hypothetical protein